MRFLEAYGQVLGKLEGMEVKPKGEVDVVICTKDRYDLLPKAVNQARQQIPYNRIIVVDSSGKPDVWLLRGLQYFGVDVLCTPNILLGFARQIGLMCASTEYAVFLDDDIVLGAGWYRRMRCALSSDAKALAASSRVVFGYQSDSALEKLHSCSGRGEGASVGVAMFKCKEVLALGGFNPNVHRGEDAELELKLKAHGYRWIRVNDAVAYHPLTFRQYMRKARDNVDGWLLIWKHSGFRLRFLIERTGAFLFMPFYYGFLTKSLKVAYYYAFFKAKTLLTFLWRVNQK